MAGLRPESPTLRQAGMTGCIPMSFNVGREYLAGHWLSFSAGAAAAGRTVDRNQWRVAHNVMLADTDEEAMELVLSGAMARTYREWMLPSYARAGLLRAMAPELGATTPRGVTVDYLAEQRWLVGSPDTVVAKLQRDLEASGGFGNIIAFTFDYLDRPEQYRRHLELLGTEVLPRIKGILHEVERPKAGSAPPMSNQPTSEERGQFSVT
jgi:alkanesulfonate monooxygenase SsuD/methylene tetrahydromethanopterin reductase-like flavin-dependent oxidoreductase (luciferase family)